VQSPEGGDTIFLIPFFLSITLFHIEFNACFERNHPIKRYPNEFSKTLKLAWVNRLILFSKTYL
jgi:hypothetical protein